MSAPGFAREQLVSFSALVGAPVHDLDGARLGSLVDVRVDWVSDDLPRVMSLELAASRGSRAVSVPADAVASLGERFISVHLAGEDASSSADGSGTLLGRHLLDHQLVDVDGVRVVRASDVYLAAREDGLWAVAIDMSFTSFLRRMLPASARTRPRLHRIIEASDIASVGGASGPVQLREPHLRLHLLSDEEILGLLTTLGHPERALLVGALAPERVAAALEGAPAHSVGPLLSTVPVESADAVSAHLSPAAAEAVAAYSAQPHRAHADRHRRHRWHRRPGTAA